jgi:hypothetical protein
VQGVANFSTATSTFLSSGGLNLTAGYAVNGVCIGAGGSSASSTLLADLNTFSALQRFSGGIESGDDLYTSGVGVAHLAIYLSIGSRSRFMVNSIFWDCSSRQLSTPVCRAPWETARNTPRPASWRMCDPW